MKPYEKEKISYSSASSNMKDKSLYELLRRTYTITKRKLDYVSPIADEVFQSKSKKIKRGIDEINRDIKSMDFGKIKPSTNRLINLQENTYTRLVPNFTLLDALNTCDINNLDYSKSEFSMQSLLSERKENKIQRKISECKKEFQNNMKKINNKPIVNMNIATMMHNNSERQSVRSSLKLKI